MKHYLMTLGAVALVFTAANLVAQDSFKNLNPVFPGNVRTNTNGVGARSIDGGIIIGGSTNWAATNNFGQGALGRSNGVASGEGKGAEPNGPAQPPTPGSAPSVGAAPGVGSAPVVGSAPSAGKGPSVGTAPKVRK